MDKKYVIVSTWEIEDDDESFSSMEDAVAKATKNVKMHRGRNQYIAEIVTVVSADIPEIDVKVEEVK